ncbi:MAG: transporter [Desulfobacterales bacterium]
MKKTKFCIVFLLTLVLFAAFPVHVGADEMLSLYGLKGYAYTYSPLPADGFHVQTGAMYSIFHENNLQCRDGYIWVVPLSLTYGDGNFWEIAAGTHWEYWKNTDFDVDETGIGDIFLGGKVRVLGQERGMPLDLSLMPYILIPTGDRDKSIGDLYNYNPTNDDEYSYGINLLLGRRWDRFYLAGNFGINHVDSDHEYIDKDTFFLGLTLEYQISETLTSYVEFISNENKNMYNYPQGHFCHDPDVGEDIREIGAGIGWVKDEWGIKVHAGAGMTETSPDLRVMALVNRSFSF